MIVHVVSSRNMPPISDKRSDRLVFCTAWLARGWLKWKVTDMAGWLEWKVTDVAGRREAWNTFCLQSAAKFYTKSEWGSHVREGSLQRSRHDKPKCESSSSCIDQFCCFLFSLSLSPSLPIFFFCLQSDGNVLRRAFIKTVLDCPNK